MNMGSSLIDDHGSCAGIHCAPSIDYILCKRNTLLHRSAS